MVATVPVKEAKSEMLAVVEAIKELARAQANSVQTEAKYGELIRQKGRQAGQAIQYDSQPNNRVPSASVIPTGQDEAVSVAQLAGDFTPIGEIYLAINKDVGGLDSSRFSADVPFGVIGRRGTKGELVMRTSRGWENIANYSPAKGELLVLGSVRYSDLDYLTLKKFGVDADQFYKDGHRRATWNDKTGTYEIQKDENGKNLISEELAAEFFTLREGGYFTYSLEMGGLRPTLSGDFLRKFKKSKSGKFLDAEGRDIVLDKDGNRLEPIGYRLSTHSQWGVVLDKDGKTLTDEGKKHLTDSEESRKIIAHSNLIAVYPKGALEHYRIEVDDKDKRLDEYKYWLVNVDGTRKLLEKHSESHLNPIPIIQQEGISNGSKGILDPRTYWIDGIRKDLGFYYDNHFCKNTGKVLSFRKIKLGSSIPAEDVDPAYKGSNKIDRKFWETFNPDTKDEDGNVIKDAGDEPIKLWATAKPKYDVRLFITIGGSQLAYDPYSEEDKKKLIEAGVIKGSRPKEKEKNWEALQVAVTLHCENGGKINHNINLSAYCHNVVGGDEDKAKIKIKIAAANPDNILTPRIMQGKNCFTAVEIKKDKDGKEIKFRYLIQRKRQFNYKTPQGVAIDEFNAIYLEFDENENEFLPVPEYKLPELGMGAVFHDWNLGEKVFQHEMRFFQAGLQGQSDGVSVPAEGIMWHGRIIDQVTGRYMLKYLQKYADFFNDDFVLNDFTEAGPMNPFLRQSKMYMQNRETAHQHFQSSRQGYFADNLETLKWEYAMARCVGDICMSTERISKGAWESTIAASIGGATAAVMGAGLSLSALPLGAMVVVASAVAGGLWYSSNYQFSRTRKNLVSQEELDRHADTTNIYGMHDGEQPLTETLMYGKSKNKTEMSSFNFVGLQNDLYCMARGVCGMVYIRNGGLKAESNFNSRAIAGGITGGALAIATGAAALGFMAVPLGVTAALAAVTTTAFGYSGWNGAMAKMAHVGRTFALQQRKEFDYFKDYCKAVFTEETVKTKDVRVRPGDKFRPSVMAGASLG